MLFSVIIPTCNRNNLLAKCLNCLQYEVQELSATDYEVIVTDDSSNNLAKDFLTVNFPWVQWVEGPKRGPAANRNNGAKYAKGEWLVFLDDDCVPESTILKAYENAINCYQNTMVFEGKVIAERQKQSLAEEAPINEQGGYLWSCNFLIKKLLFTEIKGFDENFPYPAMEDIDLQIRLQKLTTIIFVNEAAVMHPWKIIKPFTSIIKHLQSHKYFARKQKVYGNFSYRWSRCKIFLGQFFLITKELVGFSGRGFFIYLERNILNFLLIFY